MNVGGKIQDRVGLSQHEEDGGGDAGEHAVEDGTPPSFQTPAHRDRDRQRQKDRHGAELRRDRQTDRRAREEIPGQRARFHELHQEEQGEQDEERQRNVADREMRALHVEDRGAQERSCEQPRAPAVQPGAQERQQHGRRRPPERGERAPRQDDPVVAGEPRPDFSERRGHDPGHIQGKRAIGEEVRIELERNEGDPFDRHRDGPFVRVEKVMLVPLEAEQAHQRRKQKKSRQRPSVASDSRWHCVSRAKGSRILRAAREVSHRVRGSGRVARTRAYSSLERGSSRRMGMAETCPDGGCQRSENVEK